MNPAIACIEGIASVGLFSKARRPGPGGHDYHPQYITLAAGVSRLGTQNLAPRPTGGRHGTQWALVTRKVLALRLAT